MNLRYETDKHELVLGQILCLEATSASSSSPPVINKCHEMGGDQEWKHRNSVNIEIYTKTKFQAHSVEYNFHFIFFPEPNANL